jgi:hypothetical protein
MNAGRTVTVLIFFDVVEPKPDLGGFPSELTRGYTLTPNFVTPGRQIQTPR